MNERIQALEAMVDILTKKNNTLEEITALQETQIDNLNKILDIRTEQVEKYKTLAKRAIDAAERRGKMIDDLSDMVRRRCVS